MTELSLRLTASEDDTMQLINRISSLPGIESVEEIADLMPHMDDPDSSSRGLNADAGPGTHLVLVQAENDDDLRRALEAADRLARELGFALEVVEDEQRAE